MVKNRKKVKNAVLVLFLTVLTLAVLFAGIRSRGRTGADLTGAEPLPAERDGGAQQVRFVFTPSDTVTP